jgi:hypothetical protein
VFDVIGTTIRGVWERKMIPTGCWGLRTWMKVRAAAIALAMVGPAIELLSSISSTVPKCDWPTVEAGTTDRPLTATPPSVTENWLGVSLVLADKLRRNARLGNFAPLARVRRTVGGAGAAAAGAAGLTEAWLARRVRLDAAERFPAERLPAERLPAERVAADATEVARPAASATTAIRARTRLIEACA